LIEPTTYDTNQKQRKQRIQGGGRYMPRIARMIVKGEDMVYLLKKNTYSNSSSD
jgi:hypothetical protein